MNEPLGLAAIASSGTNYTPVGILAAIFVPICAAVAVVLWNYYRLQRHRADSGAMASYRKLACAGRGDAPGFSAALK